MPYVKSVPVHACVEKSLTYILNPNKTENLILTAALNRMTEAEYSYTQMKMNYDYFAKDTFDSPKPKRGKTTVKAIHYIMSFADSENVTPELAHKIAKSFVLKAFGDNVQAVIATHVNTDHTHAHIIINSYSLTGHKYIDNQTTLHEIREITNGVCRALGVEPALNFENKGRSMKYNEWQHKKNGTSWKEQIRQAIDNLIPNVNLLDELLKVLEEHGYKIKQGKYIGIKAPAQKRFVRTKTLGEEYTEESLTARILYRDMGTGKERDEKYYSELAAAYAAIIGEVRILAEQHKKVQRKRVITDAYSVENDLDMYRLSAQLSVINKDRIGSIGELEGKLNQLRIDYEKERQTANKQIEEHNRLHSLLEQAEEYYGLLKQDELSDAERLKLTVCRQALRDNVFCTLPMLIRFESV